MEFNEFRDLLRSQVVTITNLNPVLFTVGVDPEVMWNTYLDSFPPGTNEMFRKRREFDCSCCRSFIKKFGNVVTVCGDYMVSIWDFRTNDSTYQPVLDTLSRLVHQSTINGVFVTRDSAFGTDFSKEVGEGITYWNHFQVSLPANFTYKGSKTIDSVAGEYTTNRQVFERSLREISADSVETVLDLISQNSIYRGEEWASVLEKFLAMKKEFEVSGWHEETRNNWLWAKSVEAGPVVGRIKNHSIGTLLLNLSEGEELDIALRKYESVMAPSNYKRPQAVFTKKMVEEARKTVQTLGLEDSLPRRFARLDDIDINNVLFADRSVRNKMGGAFDRLSERVPVNPKTLDRVEEVPAERFLTDVLPRAKSLEVFVENKHAANLVSLIAPQNTEAPTLLKWGNNFSWAYNGNIADSMKERVKQAGGKVDGVLRFSIQWNDDGDCPNDFDAHCVEPNGNHISYREKTGHPSTGMLDVDIIQPASKQVAVENITWTDERKMREGIYEFYVHNYSHRGGKSGFAAEIEYGGEIHQFEYRRDIRQGEQIPVATVKYSRANGIEFVKSLPSSFTPRTVWGINTNGFVPVLAVMFSPNYWTDSTGNRHIIFALKGCVNDTTPNGFFNEFLKQELMPHKRVFEALAREMRVEPSEDQLSGLGFASTKRNSLLVKVGGASNRTIKVMF